MSGTNKMLSPVQKKLEEQANVKSWLGREQFTSSYETSYFL